MTRHIHVHIHRATTQDSSEWDESKHKRADNGQFGAGGGAAKKTASKSPAGVAKKSEAPAKHSPGVGSPTKEQQARQLEEKASKLHQQAQAEFQKNGRTDEYVRLKNEAQKTTNQGTDLMVQAEAEARSAKKPEGPSGGEVGSSEKDKYGVYFKKGDTVRLPGGKTAEVISHVGPSVETTAGNFHPTKISAAPRRDNPYNVSVQLAGRKAQLAEVQKEMKTGKYSSDDMELLREKEASLKRQIANYEAKAGAAK